MKCKDTLTLSLFSDETVPVSAPETKQAELAQKLTANLQAIAEEQHAINDSTCKEWRWCQWGEACMSPANDQEAFAYCENPRKAPLSALSRDELKVVAAGFPLVKYFREEKTIRVSEADPANGWIELPAFATYAQAERKLKALKEEGHIESSVDGTIVMTGWNIPGRIKDAGFEFYRRYGHRAYDAGMGCCIKTGSRNWSNLAKYDTTEQLQQAWEHLMQQPKALEG